MRKSLPKTIFLQSDTKPLNKSGSCEGSAIYRWAYDQVLSINRFTREELFNHQVPLTKDALVVGSPECVAMALRQLGAVVPEVESYPMALRKECFLKRSIAKVKAKNLDNVVGVTPRYFMKSQSRKAIEGQIIEGVEATKAMCERLESVDESYVWVSTTIDILAEWRVYQIDGEIVGIARYDDGENWVPELDLSLVESGMSSLAAEHPAAAHVADWAVTKDGETVLIEVNDAWSVSCYGGMDYAKYGEMLWARWKEMVEVRE